MTATYTFDVFSSLDGFGSASGGDWGGYWGKRGPELLDHRLSLYSEAQRMVFGAKTYRLFAQMLASSTESPRCGTRGSRGWRACRRRSCRPRCMTTTTVEVKTVASGDAVDVVARLKQESDVPLRSHGSLSMNRALMGAGLVDRVQVTLFPVITGENGSDAIFQGAADFDLELIESLKTRRQHPRAHLPADPACLSASVLELQDAERVAVWVDDPGCQRETDVCDPVRGRQAGRIVVLHLNAARSQFGDFRRHVGDNPNRLRLGVRSASRALRHVEPRWSGAERDRLFGFIENLEAELLVVEASRLAEIAREKHDVDWMCSEHLYSFDCDDDTCPDPMPPHSIHVVSISGTGWMFTDLSTPGPMALKP